MLLDSDLAATPPSPPPPAAEPESARYFDGDTNRRHIAAVYLEDRLEIFEGQQPLAAWPYDDLRAVEGPVEPLVLRCVSALPLARLHVRDAELAQAIRTRAQFLDAEAGDGNTARIVGWSLGAIASIVCVILFGLPLMADRLAQVVPYWLEQRYGDVADRQIKTIFGSNVCTNPKGVAALEKLVEKVKTADGLTTPLQTITIRTFIPNALALPGGRVYLLSPILQRANSVDELAGVIAHEFGHLAHRDHLRGLIQNAGTSYLIGLLYGDVLGSSAVLFATRTLLQQSYSREKEAQADAFAAEVMLKLGRSPKALGDFLVRLSGPTNARTDNANMNLLASHPMSVERRDTLAKADRPATGAPLLSDEEWMDLRTLCVPVATTPPARTAPTPAPARPAPVPQPSSKPPVNNSPELPPSSSSSKNG